MAIFSQENYSPCITSQNQRMKRGGTGKRLSIPQYSSLHDLFLTPPSHPHHTNFVHPSDPNPNKPHSSNSGQPIFFHVWRSRRASAGKRCVCGPSIGGGGMVPFVVCMMILVMFLFTSVNLRRLNLNNISSTQWSAAALAVSAGVIQFGCVNSTRISAQVGSAIIGERVMYG